MNKPPQIQSLIIRLGLLVLAAWGMAACIRQASAGIYLPSRYATPAQVHKTPSPTRLSLSMTASITALQTAATSNPTQTATTTPATTVTRTPSNTEIAASAVGAPILLYHRISDDTGSYRYAVTVAAFRSQMKLLFDLGYHTITISQLADAIRSGASLPEKPVVLTFDDGFQDVYDTAFPILQEYGFIATTYIITGVLETDLSYGYMQPEQLSELVTAGWEIGSHSISHEDIKSSKLGMGKELDDSRAALEEKLGCKVRSFAYPFAAANDWIKDQVKAHGYESAVGVGTFNQHTVISLYYLSRREVYHSLTLAGFKELLALPPSPTETPTASSTAETTP